VFDSWSFTGLEPTPDPPNPSLVERRLGIVIWRITRRIIERPETVGQGRDPLAALAGLPDLEGKNLKDCFALLRAHFSDPIGSNPGDWLHVLFCH
jgi:hypothetical protein